MELNLLCNDESLKVVTFVTPGCVYAEEGDGNQSPFCFKENGDNLSFCLSGSELLAPIAFLCTTAETETRSLWIGTAVSRSKGPPVNWSHQSNGPPSQLVPQSTGLTS